jgi:hypothetical protein
MSDNLKRRGPEDPNTINVHQSYEVGYWMQMLHIKNKAVLYRAIKAVGTRVVDVKRWLKVFKIKYPLLD